MSDELDVKKTVKQAEKRRMIEEVIAITGVTDPIKKSVHQMIEVMELKGEPAKIMYNHIYGKMETMYIDVFDEQLSAKEVKQFLDLHKSELGELLKKISGPVADEVKKRGVEVIEEVMGDLGHLGD